MILDRILTFIQSKWCLLIVLENKNWIRLDSILHPTHHHNINNVWFSIMMTIFNPLETWMGGIMMINQTAIPLESRLRLMMISNLNMIVNINLHTVILLSNSLIIRIMSQSKTVISYSSTNTNSYWINISLILLQINIIQYFSI